jgi:hypothetical protein
VALAVAGLLCAALATAAAPSTAATPAADASSPTAAGLAGSPRPARGAAGTDAWRASVRDFAIAHFRNPAWGHSHSARIYALAKELAAADGAALDDDVLYAAAWLHDMAAFPPWRRPELDHADVAADLVGEMLRDTGFPMEKLEPVRGAIRSHMYFRDPATGLEALYLHDADTLDWLGAIGVARIFGIVDANGGAPDGPAAAQMLERNLAAAAPRVLSPAGRARVAERKAELERFLQSLRAQTNGFSTL